MFNASSRATDGSVEGTVTGLERRGGIVWDSERNNLETRMTT